MYAVCLRRTWFPLLLCLSLSACSFFGHKKDASELAENWPEEKLYLAAKKRLVNRTCDAAIDYYQKLQARYPFGTYAPQAQLEMAYCQFKSDKTEEALATIDRFLKLNPAHLRTDYAFYLRGLVNFNPDKGMTARFLPRDAAQRDPGAELQSFNEFSELVKRFPESLYAPDARQRMIYLRNTLAQHEINVANFYMRRGAFVAAANRARYVIENFQQTQAIPQALVILAKAYRVLELNDLSDSTLRVLRTNYPDNPGIIEIERTRVK